MERAELSSRAKGGLEGRKVDFSWQSPPVGPGDSCLVESLAESDKSGDLWLFSAVDTILIMIQLVKRTNGGLGAGVCTMEHMTV